MQQTFREKIYKKLWSKNYFKYENSHNTKNLKNDKKKCLHTR